MLLRLDWSTEYKLRVIKLLTGFIANPIEMSFSMALASNLAGTGDDDCSLPWSMLNNQVNFS